MKILIIGGTNFIGPMLVRRLLAMGHQVTLFTRGLTTPNRPDRANLLSTFTS